MKRAIKWGLGLLVVALILAGGAAYWVWGDMQRALEQPIVAGGSSELFEIERGATLTQVAKRLQHKGWIARAEYLRLEGSRLKLATALKAGLYEIHNGDTPRELLRRFVAGDVKSFEIRIAEGSTYRDMRAKLAADENLRQTLAEKDEVWVLAQIAPGEAHPEGYFFPATYRFSNGDSDLDILRRAHSRMKQLLSAQWEQRAAEVPYRSPYEALIMASIIEKEAGRNDERARIAGVFVLRMAKGMKLQTDPTVIYGLGDKFDGDLRRADLRRDTTYNTYTRHGLPPTPIALPSEASIYAALHPLAEDYLFFVGRGDGTHQFSRDLTEHNAAVRRYQLGGR